MNPAAGGQQRRCLTCGSSGRPDDPPLQKPDLAPVRGRADHEGSAAGGRHLPPGLLAPSVRTVERASEKPVGGSTESRTGLRCPAGHDRDPIVEKVFPVNR